MLHKPQVAHLLSFFSGDIYPWQACLDENTNCYYYWNVETNEVQWHPPEQLSVAADTQSVDDSTAVGIPSYDGDQEEQCYQEEEDNDIPKGDYRHDKFIYTLTPKGWLFA